MARPIREIPWTDTSPEGVYYVYWYDKAARRTKRKSLGTRSQDEAQARFAAFLTSGREIYNGHRIVDEGMTAGAAIDYYEKEHVSRNVVDKERLDFAFKNIRAEFEDSDLKDLAEEDFESYAEKRRSGAIGRPSQDATIRREISAFRAAVNHNVRRRRLKLECTPIWWLPDNPETRCDKWLTMKDVDMLFGAATTKRVERFCIIGYWTAGRKSAVELLQPNRVDLQTRKIDLQPPLWKRTKKRNAIVPIVPPLFDYMGPLVVAMDERDYFIGGDIRKEFRATVKAAGLDDRGVTPHWLRHSRATHLLQEGKKLWDVAGLLGDTVATVEQVYGHHCPHHLLSELS